VGLLPQEEASKREKGGGEFGEVAGLTEREREKKKRVSE
jgi:hypothetical protein